jgi:hypothetical protein
MPPAVATIIKIRQSTDVVYLVPAAVAVVNNTGKLTGDVYRESPSFAAVVNAVLLFQLLSSLVS